MNLPLEDIVLPQTPGFWPPAPGWLGLGLLLVGLMLGSAWLGWRHFRARRGRRAALRALGRLQQSNRLSADSVNALLKQAALAYFDRSQVAALHGQAWWLFLHAAVPATRQDQLAPLKVLASDTRFAPLGTSQADDLALAGAARLWLRHALPPRRRHA